uniref:Ion transport domain-containing protein n=1 Tax=Electrophorus electricus TaxID=8005 RepID=A0AAY5EMU6_ELEEL
MLIAASQLHCSSLFHGSKASITDIACRQCNHGFVNIIIILVISRAPGLKLVVETLITSLKPIGNIVLICCAFFIIFGILGVQVDGWVNIMYHGLDAVGIDQQPWINNNPWMLLYFISFLLIVSFFVLNMFVGVVVENFHNHYLDLFITLIICVNTALKYCNYFFSSTFVVEATLKLIAFGFRRFFKDSRHATFENFGMAFLTLFQVSTGDNWNGIMKDTLRECPPGDTYSCNASLQFISPMYFVSFVLTAQFVLINVVVAVLMKHLDDSNKEAQEDAEMDAEIEMELAQGGLCCLSGLAAAAGPGMGVGGGALGGALGGAGGERPGGEDGVRPAVTAGAHVHIAQSGSTAQRGGYELPNHRKLYSPAQVSVHRARTRCPWERSFADSSGGFIRTALGSVHSHSPRECSFAQPSGAHTAFRQVSHVPLQNMNSSNIPRSGLAFHFFDL